MPPQGSALYYALQMVPRSKHTTLRTWWQWWHEVSAIPYDVHDPGVAESKLMWWRQEVSEAIQGRATHPLTRVLFAPQNNAPGHPGTPGQSAVMPASSLLLEQIDGLIDLVHQTRWLDTHALRRHQARTTGNAAEACCLLLGCTSDAARQAAKDLGVGLRQAHQLVRLGQDARAGWVNVPIDVLQQHQVKAHELTKPTPQASAHWPALHAYLCKQARDQLNQSLQALRALPRQERRALRPLVALAHMSLALIEVVQHSEDRILHERLLLTPLRKSWIATRVKWGLLR